MPGPFDEPPEETCVHGTSVWEPCYECGHDPDDEAEAA